MEFVIISCHQCLAKNRVPVERMADAPICGKCKIALDINRISQPVDVSDRTFDQQVFASNIPVLVDCWAPWCGPCRAFAPILDQLAAKYAGRLKVAKLNVDENSGIGSRYRISSVPTLMLIKNGKLIEQIAGALPLEQLEAKLAKIL